MIRSSAVPVRAHAWRCDLSTVRLLAVGQACVARERERGPSVSRRELQVSGLPLDLPNPNCRLALGAEPPLQVHLRWVCGNLHHVRFLRHHVSRARQVHVVRWVSCSIELPLRFVRDVVKHMMCHLVAAV